ncbi:MAG: hypothetical protein JSS87_06110 [Acidobacteria bacterium]|nr:hypothetical protein [Acidobacteriota bacterium]
MRISLPAFCACAALALVTFFSPAQTAPSSPEVAPGVSLPSGGLLYALDKNDDKPSLVALHATEILSNTHAGSNFARSMVYSGPHFTVEIANSTSERSIHTKMPVFYLRLSGSDAETMRSRVALLRLWNGKKNTRVAAEFSRNIFGGSNKRVIDEVAIKKEDVGDSGWLKITPESPLEPREYAIAFVPKDKLLFADTLYDFTVVDSAK